MILGKPTQFFFMSPGRQHLSRDSSVSHLICTWKIVFKRPHWQPLGSNSALSLLGLPGDRTWRYMYVCIHTYDYAYIHTNILMDVCACTDTYIHGMPNTDTHVCLTCMNVYMHVSQGCGQTPRSNVHAQGNRKPAVKLSWIILLSKSNLQMMVIQFTT